MNTVAAAMQIPSQWEEGWMFQHRELSATWSQLVLQEKHLDTWCCAYPSAVTQIALEIPLYFLMLELGRQH